jgi:hypothetical protein
VSALPRADCPFCGRNVALRRGGELREHVAPIDNGQHAQCMANGQTLAAAQFLADVAARNHLLPQR